MNKIVSDYWRKHYIEKGLCSLCGNKGIIDTISTATSPSGINAGRLNFCICPNGQTMRDKNENRN